jgi:hypothetical protein
MWLSRIFLLPVNDRESPRNGLPYGRAAGKR